ncbi:Protein trichome birefringence-like 11 [Hibiscus syriacus]|uniref:Protein trichome birefringence-like 11 n=1 Tax=Hibiscus syriacus TaxID=106335 RepID=A0A6A3D783_HIBSY|nr:Protein trichome birefringence-like 11 [Hibiscus syriacus]
MRKVPVQQDHEAMPSFDLCSRFKRFKLLESSVGVLGFFLVAVCVICYFYLDYRAVAKGYMIPNMGERFMWLNLEESSSSSISEIKRVDFLSIEGGGCDVFDGDWVWDESCPLYESKDYSFLVEGFRFDGKVMLEKLRNKRLVFVSDSIGRNKWESLLCMLASVVDNKDLIYEVNCNPVTKHKGYLVFKFKDYNCTVEYYRSPFLVLQSRPPPGSPQNVKTTLKLDQNGLEIYQVERCRILGLQHRSLVESWEDH